MSKKVLFHRFLYIIVILIAVFVPFYLYLPQQQGMVQTMNATLGYNHAQVVCVGSSHIFAGINPIQMYEEYGIAAYDIACGSQAPWQSFYYIKRIIKDQTPNIIVLDVYMCEHDPDTFTDGRAVMNLIDYPFSIDKWKAIMASDVENPLGLMLVFPYTYDDYSDYQGLTVHKNIGFKNLNMGIHIYRTCEAVDESTLLDAHSITEREAIPYKNEEYLRKSIEYCIDQGVDIILVNAPWPGNNEKSQRRFNYIQDIADEYGVPFMNGCLYTDEIGLDYDTDIYGNDGHLNLNGVEKFTRFFADYLTETYEVEDCRGNKEYRVYDEAIEWYRDYIEGTEE